MDNRFVNVILLGAGFMVLFTAFQATGMISVLIFHLKIVGIKNILSSKVSWKE
jgi:hypothetical protein